MTDLTITNWREQWEKYYDPKQPEKLYVSYNQVHKSLGEIAPEIKTKFDPDIIVGIGGGGFIPSRILRTFINVPILSIGIQLYKCNDKMHPDGPQKFQWFDSISKKQIVGKRVLLVDEVDDTRTTLRFCVDQLGREFVKEIGVLVLHNKKKEKEHLNVTRYFACHETDGSQWIVYPWEAEDIEKHDSHITK